MMFSARPWYLEKILDIDPILGRNHNALQAQSQLIPPFVISADQNVSVLKEVAQLFTDLVSPERPAFCDH